MLRKPTQIFYVELVLKSPYRDEYEVVEPSLKIDTHRTLSGRDCQKERGPFRPLIALCCCSISSEQTIAEICLQNRLHLEPCSSPDATVPVAPYVNRERAFDLDTRHRPLHIIYTCLESHFLCLLHLISLKMSFDQLSSLESQPTTMRRQEDTQYADDPEFQRLSQELMDKLFTLSGNISRLSNEIALLGTKRDTERVRERVHDLLEESKDAFKDVGEGVKTIQAWEDVSVCTSVYY